MRTLKIALLSGLSTVAWANESGIPASDTLGADDLDGNPTFIGGIANSGSTAHGIW